MSIQRELPSAVLEDPDSTNAAHEKGEPGAAEADTLRAYLRQIGRVPLLTTQEERQLCEQIETARVALAAALLAAPSPRHRISALAKEVLGGTVESDVLLQAPDGRELHSQETGRRRALAGCRRAARGAELERIDHELANNVTPERRLELRQRSGRDSHVSRPNACGDTGHERFRSSRWLLTPASMPTVNVVVVLRCDSRHYWT